MSRIPRREGMFEGALLIGALGAAYIGFGLFALSQVRHWRQVLDAPPPSSRQRRMLRALGGAALGLSLALALLRDGPSFGTLLWATGISLAALAVAFTLAWRPRWLKWLTLLAAPACITSSRDRSPQSHNRRNP